MLKQTLVASVMTMGMFAGAAYAHVETPLPGDSINYSQGVFSWNAGNTSATGTSIVGNNNLVGFHFQVDQAGVVDIFGNDFDSVEATNTSIYLFQKDAVGHDWTNVKISFNGDNDNFTTPKSAVNTYGVPVTGWFDVVTAGQPEAGMTVNLAQGVYMALLVSSQGAALPVLDGTFSGFKYSEGWSFSYLGEQSYAGLDPYQLTLRVASGSTAVIGSVVPVPGAVWLMGSALVGFGAVSRKKPAINV
jgi:hypothetical protein